jgi:DNA-binding GntR family transcriptional regulator
VDELEGRTVTGDRVPARGRRVGRTIGSPSSVTEIAADEIRARIVTGSLPMGSHIVEQELADDVGVGRAALREALRIVERDGLVVHLPRAGVRVTTLTVQDAYEMVVLREHLEDLAVRDGIPCPSEDRIARLSAAVEPMADAADSLAAATSAIEFLRAFIALPGNRKLDVAFGTIAYPLGMLMTLNRSVADAFETPLQRADRHRKLADLVAEGRADLVRAEMRSHSTTHFLRAGGLEDVDTSDAAKEWATRA